MVTTVKFVSYGSIMSIRVDSIYAVRLYGNTIEVHYGPKETISLPFSGNEDTVETLRKIFSI